MNKFFKRLTMLMSMLRSLAPVMINAILFGTLGFYVSTKLLVLPFEYLSKILDGGSVGYHALFILLTLALSRGIFRYIEQLSNHFIAFKILELIRNKVYSHMKLLAPARLEGRDKGNLITILTSDIEAIEVFYAHTISPIAIAVTTSVVYMLWLSKYSVYFAVTALLFYIILGVIIPVTAYKSEADNGQKLRNELGFFNSYLLDTLKGRDELLQYRAADFRTERLADIEKNLNDKRRRLKSREGKTMSMTDLTIMLATTATLILSIYLVKLGLLSSNSFFIPVMIMMNSFGATLALSSLSNNMFTTVSAINRVLDILVEKPKVYDITNGKDFVFDKLKVDRLSFAYDDEKILEDISLELEKNKTLFIKGVSGSGKSTLLKLLMRFWRTDDDCITYNDISINEINTSSLRKNIAYVTQDTYIYSDTIKNNILIGRLNASDEEVKAAAKKANLDKFIEALPDGYDTKIGKANPLSGGQRQRIGLARAFISNANLILLDEPTSNLDVLSEGEILKVLEDMKHEKTVILISHRKSTASVADSTIKIERGRLS